MRRGPCTSRRVCCPGRAGHYAYVSSRSVYRWPIPVGLDEGAPVAHGNPDSDDAADYQAAKRGGELAVLDGFDGPPLLARAGLIIGPYEITGRLPWWLGAAGHRRPDPGSGSAGPAAAVHRRA